MRYRNRVLASGDTPWGVPEDAAPTRRAIVGSWSATGHRMLIRYDRLVLQAAGRDNDTWYEARSLVMVPAGVSKDVLHIWESP